MVALDAGAAPARLPRKKLALVVGYDGSHFIGSQANRDLETVDGVLAHALHKAGLISPNARDGTSFGNMWWTRTSRTDRGVHALSYVVTVKARAAHDLFSPQRHSDKVKDQINAVLPPYIRVLSVAQCVHGFHARRDARSRVYHYFLPVEALFPTAGEPLASLPAPSTQQINERVTALNGIVSEFAGTHAFHNLTKPSVRGEIVTPAKGKDEDGNSANNNGFRALYNFGDAAAIRPTTGDQPMPPWLAPWWEKAKNGSAGTLPPVPPCPEGSGPVTRLIHEEWVGRMRITLEERQRRAAEGEQQPSLSRPVPAGHGSADNPFSRVYAALFEGAQFSSVGLVDLVDISAEGAVEEASGWAAVMKRAQGWRFDAQCRRTIYKAEAAGPFWVEKATITTAQGDEGGKQSSVPRWRVIRDANAPLSSTAIVPPVFETNVDGGSEPGSLWDRGRFIKDASQKEGGAALALTTAHPSSPPSSAPPPSAHGLVRLTFHGSSFVLNQIRHMVGLSLAVLHGKLPLDYLRAALTMPLLPLPMPRAPSAGLVQGEAHFNDGCYTTLYHPPGTPDEAVPVIGDTVREARLDAHGHTSPLTALTGCSDVALLLSRHRAEQAELFESVLLPRIAQFCGWEKGPADANAAAAAPDIAAAEPLEERDVDEDAASGTDELPVPSSSRDTRKKQRADVGDDDEASVTPVEPSLQVLSPIAETCDQYLSDKLGKEVPSQALVDAALRWYRDAWLPSVAEQRAKRTEGDLSAQTYWAKELWAKDGVSQRATFTTVPPLHLKEPLHLQITRDGSDGALDGCDGKRKAETAFERDQRGRRESRAQGYLKAAEEAQAYSRELAATPAPGSQVATTPSRPAAPMNSSPVRPPSAAKEANAPVSASDDHDQPKVSRLKRTRLAQIRQALLPNGLQTALSLRTGIVRQRDLDALVDAIAWRIGQCEWPPVATAEQHAEWAASPEGAGTPALLVREGRFLAMKERAELKHAANRIAMAVKQGDRRAPTANASNDGAAGGSQAREAWRERDQRTARALSLVYDDKISPSLKMKVAASGLMRGSKGKSHDRSSSKSGGAVDGKAGDA